MPDQNDTAQHPSYPLGQRVRSRMHGTVGTVTLSQRERIYVRWDEFATLSTFDGWQAGNNLRRIGARHAR